MNASKLWYDLDMSHKERYAHTEQFVVSLGDRGRVVLPASLREKLQLTAGDRLILTVDEDGSLRVASLRQVAKKFRGYFKDLVPAGRSLAAELIQERRDEAGRENKD